jgi:hypothetical protein
VVHWALMAFLILGTNKQLDKLIQQNKRLLGAMGSSSVKEER